MYNVKNNKQRCSLSNTSVSVCIRCCKVDSVNLMLHALVPKTSTASGWPPLFLCACTSYRKTASSVWGCNTTVTLHPNSSVYKQCENLLWSLNCASRLKYVRCRSALSSCCFTSFTLCVSCVMQSIFRSVLLYLTLVCGHLHSWALPWM